MIDMVDNKKKAKPKSKVVKSKPKSKVVKSKPKSKVVKSKPKSKVVKSIPKVNNIESKPKMDIKDVTIDAYDPSWGIGSFVSSLIGLFTAIIPFVGLLFGGFAIVAYFLQAKIKATGLAISGLIIGILAVLINIFFIFVFFTPFIISKAIF